MPTFTAKPKECSGCPLEEIGEGFIFPEGNGSTPLLLTGESPGYNEILEGLPFRPSAQAGSILHRVIREKAKHTRGQLVFNNLCMCRPPADHLLGMGWEYEAVNHCRVHFDRVVNKYKPRVILALGAVPFKHLTGLEGHNLNINMVRGYVFSSSRYPNTLVVPTFHPSYIRRGNAHLMGILLFDYLKAFGIAQGQKVEFIMNPMEDKTLKYNLTPTIEDALYYLGQLEKDPLLPISIDIETKESIGKEEDEIEDYGEFIKQIQFSSWIGTGIAFPFEEPFYSISKKICALPNPKIGHNFWDFDRPILGKAGVKVEGRVDDTMWCLRGDTKIKLYNGTTKTIKDIVDNKLDIDLLGTNSNNEPIPVSITEWHKNKIEKQKWIRIKTDGTRFPIICTPDHKIYTNEGWKYAKDIQLGDNLLLPSKGADDVIQGLLLGDGCYTKSHQLWVGHSEKQVKYATALADYFDVPLRYSQNHRGEKTYYFNVTCSKSWQNTFYEEGYKSFIPPFSMRALAIWYMDDGCLMPLMRYTGRMKGFNYKIPKDYHTGDGRACIAISPEFKEQWESIWDYFELKFGDGDNIIVSDNAITNEGGNVRLGKSTRDRFFEAVAPYIHPSMDYKLPNRWKGLYNGWMDKKECQWGYVEVVEECKYSRGGGYNNIRYCVDVDSPNHSFFTLGGLVHNCMHHYQSDIPIGLQATASFFSFPFPWKHLGGENLAFYGIADTDAPLRIMEHLPKRLKDRDLWRGYEELVFKIKPILIKTQDRGYPVNKEKQEVFRKAIQERKGEIEGEIKVLVPPSFTKYHPEEGYKNIPTDLKTQIVLACAKKGLGAEALTIPNEEIGGMVGLGVVGFKQGSCGFCRQSGKIKEKNGGEIVCPACQGGGFRVVRRYCKVLPFNPNSSDQVSDLIKYKKHGKIAEKLAIKLAKESRSKIDLHDFKDDEEDKNVSTSKGVLKGLAVKTGEKVYSTIVEYRELTKMEGTFLGGGKKKGWKPGEDGRVHTTFTFRPPTVQTSSRDPNIQQGPVHSKLAERFNETIEAKEGHVLTKLDYKSYHALMLGFLAEDEDYIKLARKDIHSYVTAHMVALPEADECIGWDDKKLIEFLKEVKIAYKSLRNDQAKHAILGIGFGLSEEGCYERYKEDFNPRMEEVLKGWGKKRSNPMEVEARSGMSKWQIEAEAQGKKKVKKLYELLRRLFPRVFKFQDKIIALADSQNYIDIPYGFRRWFWAAGEPRYDRWGNVLSVKKGEQAQQAMAYPVAANAFCHMREGMRIMEDGGTIQTVLGEYKSPGGLLDEARLVNMVHDDLRFEPREDQWEMWMRLVLTVMRRRSGVLKNWTMPEGFYCEVDIKVGKSLAEMEEVSL